MREIKFRAIRKGSNEFLFGDLVHNCEGNAIFPNVLDDNAMLNSPDYYTIDTETIGQFTGLRDKNGKEIFEGDLVAEISKVEDLEKWGKPLIVEFGEYSDGEDSWGLNYGTTGFLLRYEDNSVTGIHSKTDKHYGFNCNELMVIGNIHQNPELLQS